MLRFFCLAFVCYALTAGNADAQHAQPPGPQRNQQAEPLFQHANVDLAWQSAQKSGRPVMVFITSGNCHYCKKMVAQTLSHPYIARATNQRYETAVLSNDHQPELVQRLGVKAFPTTMVVGTDGSVLAAIQGFVEPSKFAARLLPPATSKQASARARSAESSALSQR